MHKLLKSFKKIKILSIQTCSGTNHDKKENWRKEENIFSVRESRDRSVDRKEYKDRVNDHDETSDRLVNHKESTDLLYNPIESRDRLDDRKESREHEEECKEIKIEIDLFESSADSLVLASIRKPKQESAFKEEFTGL